MVVVVVVVVVVVAVAAAAAAVVVAAVVQHLSFILVGHAESDDNHCKVRPDRHSEDPMQRWI